MLWAQAPKCGSCSIYPSRGWLRGSLPVVWHDRTRKEQWRSCTTGAVGADGTRRGVILNRGQVTSTHRLPRETLWKVAFSND